MRFWDEINTGRGFSLDVLTADELAMVRETITSQYLDQLGAVDPELRTSAARVGIDNYHTQPIPFEHGSFWSKEKRVLGESTLRVFAEMGFFRRIRALLPSANIYPDDLMWRIVRPGAPDDVGPVHADKWFWDVGNGSLPDGTSRFKIWIAVFTEPGLNGLSVKSHSQMSDRWKHHFEFKHGTMKPVLDETPEELEMEILPLKPGEMVFFHDALLHGGVLNRGTGCRVSVELTVSYTTEEGERLLAGSRRQAA